MLPESRKGLLLDKLELLDLKPLTYRPPFRIHCRRIAKTGTGSSQIVLEFLTGFAKHVEIVCLPESSANEKSGTHGRQWGGRLDMQCRIIGAGRFNGHF